MSEYIRFYDEAPMWLRIVMSALWIPAFLYRLFQLILDHADEPMNLVYLILSVIPFIGTVIFVIDIVWCALRRPLPLSFADWFGDGFDEKDAVDVESEEKTDAE